MVKYISTSENRMEDVMSEQSEDKVYIESILDYVRKHNGQYPAYDCKDSEDRAIGMWFVNKVTRLKIGSVSDDEIDYLRNSGINFGVKLLNNTKL